MELIKALGISWPTLISQFINFGILYFLLKKFALEGLLDSITKRQAEIMAGLDNAKAADQSLAQAKAQEEEILCAARAEAQSIIADARANAQAQEQQILANAKQQSLKIVADGEHQVEVAKGKMLLEAKAELADIITTGIRKLTGEKVSTDTITTEYLQAGMKA